MKPIPAGASRLRILLLLLVLLAGAGCASGKWAWQLTEKEKRIDHVKAKEAPAVGRPSRCMEDLATILNCIAARNT